MTDKAQGSGCVVSVIGLNAVLIGLLASQFARGPYSSWEQEVWYRYGSLGFLLAGAVLPAAALALGARRSAIRMTVLVYWMLAVLCACFFYAIMSTGGV